MKNQRMRRHFSSAADNGDTTGPEEKISAAKRKISAEEIKTFSEIGKQTGQEAFSDGEKQPADGISPKLLSDKRKISYLCPTMRAVIQRVSRASVSVDGDVKGAIEAGLLILLGVEEADEPTDADWLAGKIARLRIFDDESGVMNRNVSDIGGSALIISQFTLLASYKKGNRPSYIRAAGHELAIPMYDYFCRQLSGELGKEVERGVFGADMQVSLLNNGPVTICMDTRNKE